MEHNDDLISQLRAASSFDANKELLSNAATALEWLHNSLDRAHERYNTAQVALEQLRAEHALLESSFHQFALRHTGCGGVVNNSVGEVTGTQIQCDTIEGGVHL